MKEGNHTNSLNRYILDFRDDVMEVIVYWSRMVLAENESLLTKDASHTFFELHYVMKGALEMYLSERQRAVVHENEFIVIPPSCSHEVTSYENDTVKFVMGFSLASEQHEIIKAIEAIGLLNVVRATEDIETSIQLLQKVSEKNGAFVNEQLHSLMRFFLLTLFSAESDYACMQDPEWYIHKRKYDVKTTTGEMIMSYIKAHPVGLTVQDLAERFHFSTRHVNRVLSESYGKTAIQLLQEEKILYIKKLIINTDLKESAIAEMCHFTNSSSMNRFFRKYEKSSVSRFKKDINM